MKAAKKTNILMDLIERHAQWKENNDLRKSIDRIDESNDKE